jgi:thiol-disulfide isomerase/thioredoxin
MLELGSPAPGFSLPEVRTGGTAALSDFRNGNPLLVIFMCNHCPYVKHIKDRLLSFAGEYIPKGLNVVGISANDPETHPDDAPEKMKAEASGRNYPFPYCFDETQETAKAYRAACTPDFFLFDGEHKLVYRGRFDGSTPGNGVPVTGEELEKAVKAVLDGRQVPGDQKPSMGCNIKWRKGNEPDYYGVQS